MLASILVPIAALACVIEPTDRVIEKSVVVDAPRGEVFAAFATREGARTFFARDAHIELQVDGAYEIYFVHDGEPGLRGTEGCRVLSYVPNELLTFTWNAPPTFGAKMRAERTRVALDFADVEAGTRVRLRHAGWGEGKEWDAVHDYFESAWDHVLQNLVRRFEVGPLWEPAATETPRYAFYYTTFTPGREGGFAEPTTDELQLLKRHRDHMIDLAARGQFVLGGPSQGEVADGLEFDSALLVLRATSFEQARGMLADDPAIAAGVIVVAPLKRLPDLSRR